MFIGWKNIVKMSILPKSYIDSMQSLSRLQFFFFYRNRKNNPKICMEPQKTLNSQSNLKSKARGITLPVCFWHKKANIDHCNREPNTCIYGQFITKEATIHNGEKTVSSISGDGKIRQLHVEEWD